MNKPVSSKIGMILLFATLFLITPAMATWIYCYYDFTESNSEPIEFEINNFEYAPVVTLPGAPIVTTPPVTTPPEPPEESTPTPEPEESTPDSEETTPTPPVTTPEETTPPPIIQPELDGTNHYNLVAIIVGTLEECKALNLEDAYYIANLNWPSSIVYGEVIEENKTVLHSVRPNTSGSHLPGALSMANADKLQFTLVINEDKDEVEIYTYGLLDKKDEGTTIEVYKTIGKKGANGKWSPDLYSVQVGTARVIKEGGRQVISYTTFEPNS